MTALGFGLIAVAVLAIYRVYLWYKTGPVGPDPWGDEVEASLRSGEAIPLCTHCLEPQNHNGWFCPNCGAAEGPGSPLLVPVQMYYLGHAFRSATGAFAKRNPLILLGYALVAIAELSLLGVIYLLFFFARLGRPSQESPGTAAGGPVAAQ
jgi:hypothetical protein